jgi:predicted PhzF superfamily epimerase YddE/YHI9
VRVTIPFWHVDAFAGKAFAGNPAGVCIMDQWPAPSVMQAIAAENSMPETAFLVPRAREAGGGAGAPAGADFDLRWFTPTVEIDLCGHATLAAAHVLMRHRGWTGPTITFSSQSGPLVVEAKGELFVLDFPSRPALPCDPVGTLVKGLGARPMEILGARDYLVVFATEDEVRGLKPDMALLSRIDRMGVIVTAQGGTRGSAEPVDFVSRFFAPGIGIPEDPVTGSAHCTLIPFWARRLRRTSLHALQVSTRGGEIFCQDAGDRVKIGGRAVTYLSGEIVL